MKIDTIKLVTQPRGGDGCPSETGSTRCVTIALRRRGRQIVTEHLRETQRPGKRSDDINCMGKPQTKTIKLFVTDNDGTMTDGKATYDHQGNVSKTYFHRDTTALYLLKQSGVRVVVMSGAGDRCDEYRYQYLASPQYGHLYQHVHPKLPLLLSIVKGMKIGMDEVAYIGDSDNDVECLREVGWAACPRNATDNVRHNSMFISEKTGGNGAVDDFADAVLRTNAYLTSTKEKVWSR